MNAVTLIRLVADDQHVGRRVFLFPPRLQCSGHSTAIDRPPAFIWNFLTITYITYSSTVYRHLEMKYNKISTVSMNIASLAEQPKPKPLVFL